MNTLPLTQAVPVSNLNASRMPVATLVIEAEPQQSILHNGIAIDLRTDEEIEAKIATKIISMNLDTDIEPSLKMLVLIRYWQEQHGKNISLDKQSVDDILHMIFHVQSQAFKNMMDSDDIQYLCKGEIDQTYLLLQGYAYRSVSISGDLYKQTSKAGVKKHYSGILMKVFYESLKQRDSFIAEMGFIKNDDDDSLHPYAIVIKKSILPQILEAVARGVKVVIKDQLRVPNGVISWCTDKYSDVTYNPSPNFRANNITYNKTEEYNSITSFVDPYIKFEINWNLLNPNAVVLL